MVVTCTFSTFPNGSAASAHSCVSAAAGNCHRTHVYWQLDYSNLVKLIGKILVIVENCWSLCMKSIAIFGELRLTRTSNNFVAVCFNQELNTLSVPGLVLRCHPGP